MTLYGMTLTDFDVTIHGERVPLRSRKLAGSVIIHALAFAGVNGKPGHPHLWFSIGQHAR